MVDAGAGAHGLYISRSDDAAVLMTVPMFQFPFQGNGDNLHILMRVGAKAFARSYPVVVQYTQGAEIHPAGIVILVETEGVVAVKPII